MDRKEAGRLLTRIAVPLLAKFCQSNFCVLREAEEKLKERQSSRCCNRTGETRTVEVETYTHLERG